MSTIITCAVVGASEDVINKHPNFPVTPEEIAEACISSARAGAAVVHIHVRDPDTKKPSTELHLYREVVERVRESDVDVILNLTCGMDGEIVVEDVAPFKIGAKSTLRSSDERVQHAVELRPELASLDCGVADFEETIFIAQMPQLREMAIKLENAGVKPELECFDFKHLDNAGRLVDEGLIKGQPLFQLCMGTGDGVPADPDVLRVMVKHLPENAIWAAFGCGKMEMPIVAAASSMGGHVRVGLEDNIYLHRGVFASNAELVENAVEIITRTGGTVATADKARGILGLT